MAQLGPDCGPVHTVFQAGGFDEPPGAARRVDTLMVDIGVYFQIDVAVVRFGEQDGLVNADARHAVRHLRKKGGDIVVVQADAAMAGETVNAGGRYGAVNAVAWNAQLDPVFSHDKRVPAGCRWPPPSPVTD